MSKRVCIVGGGLSGLAAAHYLRRRGLSVIVFEKAARTGGNFITEQREGFLLESGPNSTLATTDLLDLIGSLGLTGEIAKPNAHAKNRFIVRGGRLVHLPSSLVRLFTTRAFSTAAKMRLLKEPFIGRGDKRDESVADFFARRLGGEIVDYAVDPFISGIYAGDPSRLSVEHAFPKLFQREQRYGSLFASVFKKNEEKTHLPKDTPRSISFRSGMQTLTDALAGELGSDLYLSSAATTVSRLADGKFSVAACDESFEFDAVIVATPANAASALVAPLDATAAKAFESVFYAPVSVVWSAYRIEDVSVDPAGFGFLAPGVERRAILGSLWTSSVFENRAPQGYHLFTTFIGGSRNADSVNLRDEALIQLADGELRDLMQIVGSPIFTAVKKWDRAIPQYNIGYDAVIDAIDGLESSYKGLYICSNFYRGISVGDCVKNARATAERVAGYLERRV